MTESSGVTTIVGGLLTPNAAKGVTCTHVFPKSLDLHTSPNHSADASPSWPPYNRIVPDDKAATLGERRTPHGGVNVVGVHLKSVKHKYTNSLAASSARACGVRQSVGAPSPKLPHASEVMLGSPIPQAWNVDALSTCPNGHAKALAEVMSLMPILEAHGGQCSS